MQRLKMKKMNFHSSSIKLNITNYRSQQFPYRENYCSPKPLYKRMEMNFNKDIMFLEKQFVNGNLSTPKIIDPDVTAFCKYLGNTNNPYYLKTEPFHWSRVNCCDLNVKKATRDQGEKIVYGFKIWSIPKLYIEASLYCIQENFNGDLIDITPKEDGEETILFLPETQQNTVRLKCKGNMPRIALKETLKEFKKKKEESNKL